MSKHNFINSDHSGSSSLKSNDSGPKELDFETETEKKNRLSLEKALSTNNNAHAFQKINTNISSFCSNIQLLQDYSLCLGSKKDSKDKSMEIEKIILKTADEIAETFNLIEIIKNFEYKEKNQKIENITKANRLEDECSKYKKIFDDLTDKIKKQNINLIKQARTSIRYSNFSDFSGEINLNNDEPVNNTGFQNGKEFLEGIEMKRKQNDAINKAAKKIEKSLSKKNVLIMNLTGDENNNNNDDNNIEIFNIENNKNKSDLRNALLPNNIQDKNNNNNDDNKYLSMNSSRLSRTSKAFHEMEDKVFIALEGPRQNFIRRHWLISLITLVLIIIILYYILLYQKQ